MLRVPNNNNAQEPVWLRVYDISKGKAAVWSQILLGRKVEGIWHTGVMVFDMEYFYGGGLDCLPPDTVERLYDMELVEAQLLGYTSRSKKELSQFINALKPMFHPGTYDLLKWNCNHFSDICCRYLLDGRGIPDSILDLPENVRQSFVGDIILKFMQRFKQQGNPILKNNDDPGASSCDHSNYSLENIHIDDPKHPRFLFDDEPPSRSRKKSTSTRKSSNSQCSRHHSHHRSNHRSNSGTSGASGVSGASCGGRQPRERDSRSGGSWSRSGSHRSNVSARYYVDDDSNSAGAASFRSGKGGCRSSGTLSGVFPGPVNSQQSLPASLSGLSGSPLSSSSQQQQQHFQFGPGSHFARPGYQQKGPTSLLQPPQGRVPGPAATGPGPASVFPAPRLNHLFTGGVQHDVNYPLGSGNRLSSRQSSSLQQQQQPSSYPPYGQPSQAPPRSSSGQLCAPPRWAVNSAAFPTPPTSAPSSTHFPQNSHSGQLHLPPRGPARKQVPYPADQVPRRLRSSRCDVDSETCSSCCSMYSDSASETNSRNGSWIDNLKNLFVHRGDRKAACAGVDNVHDVEDDGSIEERRAARDIVIDSQGRPFPTAAAAAAAVPRRAERGYTAPAPHVYSYRSFPV